MESCSDAMLVKALAREALRRVCAFNSKGLANAAWAFATTSQPEEQLFAALANEALRRIVNFDAR